MTRRLALVCTPGRWPFAVQIVAAIVVAAVLLPVAARLYGAWWDVWFGRGSFVSRFMPPVEGER